MTYKKYDFTWQFPLPRVHTGMMLGNARLGAMIWGGGNVLHVTFGRGDWWDHRGGRPWTELMNFRDIRRALEVGDRDELERLFDSKSGATAMRATLVPVGRFDLHLPPGCEVSIGRLDRHRGVVTIEIEHVKDDETSRNSSAQRHEHRPENARSIEFEMCMDRPLMVARLLGDFNGLAVKPRPAYETAGQTLAQRGIEQPVVIKTADDFRAINGFTQALPDDPALAAIAARTGVPGNEAVWFSVELGDTPTAARETAERAINDAGARRATESSLADKSADNTTFAFSRRWWAEYWADNPTLTIPDEKLQFLFDYGCYKFAIATCPLGPPAGLQGPFIEDHTAPPWSGDYHFNINVQMIYTPAYATNHLSHLRPLLEMVLSWREKLADNAKKFIGIDNGLMLPHAVDDQCQIMGTFWTGTIDHACTAWVGKMLYDYWTFGGAGDDFARDVVFPFLQGALNVFVAMLERDADGRYVLPVSVSPEYRAAELNAWGKNATFQLASLRDLCEKLLRMSQVLNLPDNPVWQELIDELPPATVEHGRIVLWQGVDLDESHRHHAHLGGLTPFDVIDPNDPQWRDIVRRTINHWVYRGMGLWSGWCMPWASQIHTRMGQADMAEMTLQIFERVFTNIGHGTLHDVEIAGLTLMGAGRVGGAGGANDGERMQLDAAMGTVTAITDMLLCEIRGVVHLFRGAPAMWQRVGFDRLRTAGGFLVSAIRENGSVSRFEVGATSTGIFRYADPESGEVIELKLSAGETKAVKSSVDEAEAWGSSF